MRFQNTFFGQSDTKIWGSSGIFLPALVWESWLFGIDSLTFESSLLTLPQKSPKESNTPDSIPGLVPTLVAAFELLTIVLSIHWTLK
jgi:hypothetical protein